MFQTSGKVPDPRASKRGGWRRCPSDLEHLAYRLEGHNHTGAVSELSLSRRQTLFSQNKRPDTVANRVRLISRFVLSISPVCTLVGGHDSVRDFRSGSLVR